LVERYQAGGDDQGDRDPPRRELGSAYHSAKDNPGDHEEQESREDEDRHQPRLTARLSGRDLRCGGEDGATRRTESDPDGSTTDRDSPAGADEQSRSSGDKQPDRDESPRHLSLLRARERSRIAVVT
jgi:hypothetical protein